MLGLNKYIYICDHNATTIFLYMLRPRPRINGSLERWMIGKLSFQDDGTTICSLIKEALTEMKSREKKEILEMYLSHYDKMTEDERKELQLKR